VIDVLHVIPSLDVGGAERLLTAVASGTDADRFRHRVLCLRHGGVLAPGLAARGVKVEALELRRPGSAPGALLSLLRKVRSPRPTLVHTWMVHSNLLGGVAARVARLPVLWSLHHSDLDPESTPWATMAVEKVNGSLARLVPDLVVTTSAAAVPLHARAGYPSSRLVPVPNGVDVPEEVPTARQRAHWRRELGLPVAAPLIGHVARWHPQKDHRTSLLAFRMVLGVLPEARLVLVGRGMEPENPEVTGLLQWSGVGDRVHLLGERPDAAEAVTAFDVCVSASAYGETSTLALSEAMVRAVPVVTTHVGDAGELAQAGALVVRPRDASALGAALLDVLTQPADERRRRGEACRTWASANRSSRVMIVQYERIYQRLSAGAAPR
jgi:glycosyltransferase involved in cell wall biosynthesis